MAYIKVDLIQFNQAADCIEKYVRKTEKHMNVIDNIVGSLGTAWQGNDFNQTCKEWHQINSKGSTTDKMLISLKNYANAIRESGNKYKNAQARAINRANILCK